MTLGQVPEVVGQGQDWDHQGRGQCVGGWTPSCPARSRSRRTRPSGSSQRPWPNILLGWNHNKMF